MLPLNRRLVIPMLTIAAVKKATSNIIHVVLAKERQFVSTFHGVTPCCMNISIRCSMRVFIPRRD